jgi:hypothetical protein
MPRNTTGGSGHKAQRNSEGSKARTNRCFVDDLLDDIKNEEKLEDVFIARVTKRMGSGRMEVFYIKEFERDEDERRNDRDLIERRVMTQIVPMLGGLRGKGKKTVWVDLDSLVMIAETGLGGTTHEIVAVFSPEQVARLRKLKPDMDERYFIKGTTTSSEPDAGFEFDAGDKDDGDVDVDNI